MPGHLRTVPFFTRHTLKQGPQISFGGLLPGSYARSARLPHVSQAPCQLMSPFAPYSAVSSSHGGYFRCGGGQNRDPNKGADQHT